MSKSLPQAIAAKANEAARIAAIVKLCATRGVQYRSLKNYRSL